MISYEFDVFWMFQGAYEEFVFGVDPLEQKVQGQAQGWGYSQYNPRCEGIPKISLALGYVEDAPTLGPYSP